MDMYQKRKKRQEKIKSENKEENSKSNINWYPGHMAKTMKQIEADLRIVDIVIELLDARIPIASQNPEIANKIKNKKKLYKESKIMAGVGIIIGIVMIILSILYFYKNIM